MKKTLSDQENRPKIKHVDRNSGNGWFGSGKFVARTHTAKATAHVILNIDDASFLYFTSYWQG
jgi:hypothetical protein